MTDLAIIQQAMSLATESNVPWTQFWDMSSGGRQKLEWKFIYINAPEAVAKLVFEKLFGRDPDHVTCDCCGEDYSTSQNETLDKVSKYIRNDSGYRNVKARVVELPEVLRVLKGDLPERGQDPTNGGGDGPWQRVES
jgi:hypothetical protein